MLEDFRAFYRLKFPYGKIRPQQIVMMEKIFHSIKNKKNLIVEAPTGVGKTLSYLIPAIYFAERGKRIIILTETID
ncbi:MAG TPA: DEAD/DEAH box helicase, partial [Methanococcaceae archaeon]|nr:DEAD/DEAH box helicase [Methanococcaceae archaeon]